MSSQLKVMKLNRKASDVWKLISDVETPETWVPFLDSRQVDSNKHDKHIYFPTDLAFFCQELISYKLINIKPEEKSVEFTLSVNHINVSVLVVVYEDKGACLLEARASAPISSDELPVVDELLFGICFELVSNIEMLANLKFPKVKCNLPPLKFPTPLKERFPEMNIREIKRVTLAEGLDEAITGAYPVIISDHWKHCEHYSLIKDFSWWKKEFGPQSMFFMDLEHEKLVNGFLQAGFSGITTCSEFIDMLASNPNQAKFTAAELMPYKLIGASDYIYPPSFLPVGSVVRHKVWMGTSHVYTPVHQDGTHTDFTARGPEKFHNLNFQVTGRKHVVLANPNQSKYLYPESSALEFKDTPPHLKVDIHKEIDFNEFPLFKKAELFETILNPGEAIYIPRAWWHSFYALDNTINHNTLFTSRIS